ncbi:MAG: amidohydrolase family protein [Geobacteraceae bacterium]|nr:amidohydrolase family protein [Geobacteraceae bacterium]
MTRDIIDVHAHCFTSRRAAPAVSCGLDKLRGEGLRHMAVLGMVNTHLDSETIWNLTPRAVENRGDPLLHEADDLLELARLTGPVILPFVDTRHMWGDVATLLLGYIGRGFRGLKGIYLADNENDIGVGNVPDTFGITLEQYQRREWEIFAFAEAHDLPLLYHMDARRYGDVMRAMLDDFPRVRVNFPHFGIGRSAFRNFLDRYPNVYTDLAGMLPHIRRTPDSYRDFILHYPDRVCFGTDTLLYAPEAALDYIRMVRELKLPEEIEARLFSGNPASYLGRALGAPAPA